MASQTSHQFTSDLMEKENIKKLFLKKVKDLIYWKIFLKPQK